MQTLVLKLRSSLRVVVQSNDRWTARTPEAASAATRIAFRSTSELMRPQRSTPPSFTVTFNSEVCAQGCALRCDRSWLATSCSR
jgi:hypothetical protein